MTRSMRKLKADNEIAELINRVQRELDEALDDDIPFVKNKAVMKDPGPQVVTNVATVLIKYPFVKVEVDRARRTRLTWKSCQTVALRRCTTA